MDITHTPRQYLALQVDATLISRREHVPVLLQRISCGCNRLGGISTRSRSRYIYISTLDEHVYVICSMLCMAMMKASLCRLAKQQIDSERGEEFGLHDRCCCAAAEEQGRSRNKL